MYIPLALTLVGIESWWEMGSGAGEKDGPECLNNAARSFPFQPLPPGWKICLEIGPNGMIYMF